jgi:hypothetical protein
MNIINKLAESLKFLSPQQAAGYSMKNKYLQGEGAGEYGG